MLRVVMAGWRRIALMHVSCARRVWRLAVLPQGPNDSGSGPQIQTTEPGELGWWAARGYQADAFRSSNASPACAGERAPLSGEGGTMRTSGRTGEIETGQMVPATGGTVRGTLAAMTGVTERPGGGLLEKEEKALVGMLLSLVDVKGDACM